MSTDALSRQCAPPKAMRKQSPSSRLAAWLLQRARPHYGLLTLWALLVCATGLGCYFLGHRSALPPPGTRTGPASVLSFLPDPVLTDRRVFYAVGALFLLAAPLWAAQRCLPWSSWAAALAFTALMALQMENATQATHVAHATNLLLLVYALWYHFAAADVRAALAAGRLWATPLYPRWVYLLSVYALGTFYGFSGAVKFLTSGPGWANGVSLQLWTYLWGDPRSLWTHAIASDRRLAAAMQWSTLVGETSGFLAVASRRLRPLVGLALMGFHVGAIAVFGWAFHANLVLLALVFLPCPYWIEALVRRWEQSAKSPGTLDRR